MTELQALNTWERLAEYFTCHKRTVQKWLRPYRRKFFRPTKRTTRVPLAVVREFEQQRKRKAK